MLVAFADVAPFIPLLPPLPLPPAGRLHLGLGGPGAAQGGAASQRRYQAVLGVWRRLRRLAQRCPGGGAVPMPGRYRCLVCRWAGPRCELGCCSVGQPGAPGGCAGWAPLSGGGVWVGGALPLGMRGSSRGTSRENETDPREPLKSNVTLRLAASDGSHPLPPDARAPLTFGAAGVVACGRAGWLPAALGGVGQGRQGGSTSQAGVQQPGGGGESGAGRAERGACTGRGW